jgi:hypothetical protein
MEPRSLPTALLLIAAPLVGGCGEIAETQPTVHDARHAREPRVMAAPHADDQVGISAAPPVRRAPPEFEDTDRSAVRLFHDVLAPYGTWTLDPRLGFVWVPAKDALGDGFVPYATHGRWTHRVAPSAAGDATEDFVWVSDLPWGWVTFHYGRWAYIGGSVENAGWAWIPGRRYSGAWVDWRVPHEAGAAGAVVGWGPTPPAHVWQISPRERTPVAVPYAAFSTPYVYARSVDLFDRDLAARLLPATAALSVAHATVPSAAPSPERLGIPHGQIPVPPAMDRGLQQAWMLATPASATAIGLGPELGPPPRLRTWVAGGPRWDRAALR